MNLNRDFDVDSHEVEASWAAEASIGEIEGLSLHRDMSMSSQCASGIIEGGWAAFSALSRMPWMNGRKWEPTKRTKSVRHRLERVPAISRVQLSDNLVGVRERIYAWVRGSIDTGYR